MDNTLFFKTVSYRVYLYSYSNLSSVIRVPTIPIGCKNNLFVKRMYFDVIDYVCNANSLNDIRYSFFSNFTSFVFPIFQDNFRTEFYQFSYTVRQGFSDIYEISMDYPFSKEYIYISSETVYVKNPRIQILVTNIPSPFLFNPFIFSSNSLGVSIFSNSNYSHLSRVDYQNIVPENFIFAPFNVNGSVIESDVGFLVRENEVAFLDINLSGHNPGTYLYCSVEFDLYHVI